MSRTPESFDALLDLVPGYVLGTLDADERAAVDAALAHPDQGAAVRAELEAVRAANDLLVQAGAVTPPPSLRDRLQARIALEAGTGSAAAAAGELASGVATGVSPKPAHVPDALDEIRARLNAPPVTRATPTSRAVRVTPPQGPAVTPAQGAAPLDDLARKRGARTGWYTAALLTAGLAATALFAVDLRNRLGVLEAQVREKNALLARVEAKLGEKEQTLNTLLAGRGNVVLVTLDATTPTGPGMQVFWNVREGKAVVNAFGLAQVASNRAYMLWLIRDGAPVPVKLFTPDENGRALVSGIEVPTSTAGISVFAVTEESAQGADAPTMTPFLAGTVPATK